MQPTPEPEGTAKDERFSPARSWRIGDRTLSFGALPMLMGIVNVTPDSFSDGGRFFDRSRAIDHALQLVADGAELIDVGGESTRPYSEPVDEAEELRRVLPVVEALCGAVDVPVSIDTSKAAVARESVRAGCRIINDVTGLTDPAMIEAALSCEAGLCVMHMQGTPQTMQDAPAYDDVVEEVTAYLEQRRDALCGAGVAVERICLDPGIGFGKTHQHNLTLLRHCGRFHRLGCPLLVGPSRKGFIADVIGDKEADRSAGTLGVTLSLALQGVQVLRVHDVAAVRQGLLLFEATGGLS